MNAVAALESLSTFEDAVRATVGNARYDLWFKGATKISLDGETLLIGVPNRFFKDWLESHFQTEIRAAAEQAFGDELSIRYRIDPALFRRAHTATPPEPAKKPEPPAPRPASKCGRFALERFVVGPANQVGYAAVQSLISDPRFGYSPLVLHGGVGVGKTHLLKATGEALRARHRNLKVLELSCEEFTNEFLENMRNGKINSFRRKMRHLDVLLLDDVQFLSNKKATQEEFTHTLNALQVKGGKVVMTCDVHPRKIPKLAEELKSRFVSGMVARLEPPTREMRRHLISLKAGQLKLQLMPEVVEFLADQLHHTVRELEGALNYLGHYSETLLTPLNLETARTALADVLRHSAPVLNVRDIRAKACEFFGLSSRQLSQRSRSKQVAFPRMLVCYLARKHTRATYNEIGQQMGGLNHSSVISAERRILTAMGKNDDILLGDRSWKLRDAVEAFERTLA